MTSKWILTHYALTLGYIGKETLDICGDICRCLFSTQLSKVRDKQIPRLV